MREGGGEGKEGKKGVGCYVREGGKVEGYAGKGIGG